MLRSAVGMAHVLRSRLVMSYTTSLVVRLYSGIDHIHLSIEAHCVSTLLPLGDCHNLKTQKGKKGFSTKSGKNKMLQKLKQKTILAFS